ncbi:MmyB family transcriptional regulator [Nocardia acididurans]|uniref:MmyB family transcriptional regulator n=1 Tax=Nocardia acididurans TaxID=2802282 RepID=UPI001E48D9AF|nr:helix-turn-helix domain-containing protein [Nocardia acididurans]
MGKLLRRLRDERQVSREKLAFNAGVSSSYITHLENGNRDRPTREVLHALVRYLDRVGPLSQVERRHLLDLAGLGAGEYPAVDQLRAWITPDMHHALTLHEPNLAAYFDTRWNLLASNESFANAFPGLTEQGNMLHWLLGNDIARQTVVEWEQEVRLLVHWLRGLLAGSGDATSSVAFLAELAQYEHFCRMWDEEAVAYGRDRPLLHLRDPGTRLRRAIVVQMFRVDSVAHADRIQIFLGIPTERLSLTAG